VFIRIWRFRVSTDNIDRFRQAYGPTGEWAALFGREIGFLGTELLQSTTEPDSFITIDTWDSPEAWAAFLRAWGDDYTALDHHTQSLAASERELGAFDSNSPQYQRSSEFIRGTQ
jgi:heme-degrading monooxygenase HmoA